MTTTSFQQAGVLVLNRITPVIKTLFGNFLTGESINNGSLALVNNDNSNPYWEGVREDLVALAEEMGLQLPATADPDSTENWIAALLAHFAPTDHDLLSIILESDEQTSMGDLFLLARSMDDVHGLRALKVEGAYMCSKPRPFEFGGDGQFYGQHVTVQTGSSTAITMGEQLEKKLAAGATAAAADVILAHVRQLLDGIHLDDVRGVVRQALGEKLLANDDGRQWFAITGRIPGDDDDTLQVFNVATVAEAHAAFEASMYEDESDPEGARDANARQYGVTVFINSTACSKTPISLTN